MALTLCLCACSAGSKREEIERRKAALVEKQDTALKNAQDQLAHYDQLLQQAEASYDDYYQDAYEAAKKAFAEKDWEQAVFPRYTNTEV